jgi:hypothetical protein
MNDPVPREPVGAGRLSARDARLTGVGEVSQAAHGSDLREPVVMTR